MSHKQVIKPIKINWLKEKNVLLKGKPRETRKLGLPRECIENEVTYLEFLLCRFLCDL